VRKRAPWGSDVILDMDTLRARVEEASRHDAFAFDIESRGGANSPSDPDVAALDTMHNEVTWISITGPAGSMVIPFSHPVGELIEEQRKVKEPWYDYDNPTKTGKPRKKWRTVTIPPVFSDPPKQLWPGDVFEVLEPLLFDPDKVKVGSNVKFDVKSLAKYFDGRLMPGPYWDTEVAQHLIDENMPSKGLKALTKHYCNFEYAELAKKGLDGQPFSAVARYALYDTVYAWIVYRRQSEIVERDFSGVMHLDQDTLEALMRAEYRGAYIDVDALSALSERLSARLGEIKALVWKDAQKEFNLQSRADVAWYVYEHRGHEVTEWTKGGKNVAPSPKTDEKTLTPLARTDPHVGYVLEHASVQKMYGTYSEGIRKWLDGSWVHPSFRLAAARTGRLSCASPNLQNIPAPDTEIGALVRGVFVAPPGHRLVVADYGQIEPRTLAHCADDPAMQEVFLSGEDPYRAMGALVYGKVPDEITKSERSIIKVLLLSVLYGAGPRSVSETSGVPLRQIEMALKAHRQAFPATYGWMRREIDKARKRKPVPYVETLLGRRRRLPDLLHPDEGVMDRARRQAINSIIQGSAGEIMKLALVRLDRLLEDGMSLTVTVHDEVVVTTPEDRAERCAEIVEEALVGEEMQELLSVPLVTDAKIVDSWAEGKD